MGAATAGPDGVSRPRTVDRARSPTRLTVLRAQGRGGAAVGAVRRCGGRGGRGCAAAAAVERLRASRQPGPANSAGLVDEFGEEALLL
jgi:hypothetical protein